MDKIRINQYKTSFDGIAQYIENEQKEQVEIWFARELQIVLGYARWENFVVAITRAVESCKTQGINVNDHFREVAKMVELGSGAKREVEDFMLTRFACYLIAQNGDPKKEEIAFAQGYFADKNPVIRKLSVKDELTNFLLYTSPDGQVKVEAILINETVWLTQEQMSQVFGVQVPAISKHLKNIFESGELNENTSLSILETHLPAGKENRTIRKEIAERRRQQ